MQSFVDHVIIHCRSGAGGNGVISWRREKYIPKGGPSGGDGGKGGSIILRGNRNLWTLLDLRYRKFIKAESGQAGQSSRKTGKSGEDVFLDVPLGTVIRNEETGELVGEVTEHDEELLLLEGGHGGLGNWHFRSPTQQAPEYATPGKPAQEMSVILELKVLADVGLVGFPNAGKSTLLSVMSAAKPKIASYPFTTLVPNLGIVSFKGFSSFVMADIPGIIEGAHEGKGLGIQFLRHIERNSVLLFVIPVDTDDIHEEYKILLNEVKSYNAELLYKPRLIAVSKCDMLDEELKAELAEELHDLEYVFISSVAQTGLEELKEALWKKINN